MPPLWVLWMPLRGSARRQMSALVLSPAGGLKGWGKRRGGARAPDREREGCVPCWAPSLVSRVGAGVRYPVLSYLYYCVRVCFKAPGSRSRPRIALATPRESRTRLTDTSPYRVL